MAEPAEQPIGVPEDLASNPAFKEMLERTYQEVKADGGLIPELSVDFAPPQDESETLFIGREFTLDEFRKWFAVQRLGSKPFNAVGYHHTGVPRPSDWAGTQTLTNIFAFFRDDRCWPEGTGPHLWVYSGEHGYSPGIPRIYVGTHPAYDGIGINSRNTRWLHIDHIWNGDDAEFSDAMKRVSGAVLAIVCARHQHADREIPLRFILDGGVDNPDQPLGIMYHRDVNPTGDSVDFGGGGARTCPGLRVTHENLDVDLLRFVPGPDPGPGTEGTATSEGGDLVAAMGAVARDAPRRNAGGNARQLDEGKTYETTGYTDDGESVEGTSRWYRLRNRKWVHASGGVYTKRAAGVQDFTKDDQQLTVGNRPASVRPGPSRDSGEPTSALAPGSTHTVDGFTDKGEEVDGVSRWYRLDGDAGWVHASGWALAAQRIMTGRLPKAGGAWETLDAMNDEIADAADQTGVPPHLIKAMLAREGSFGKDWGKPPVFFEGRPSEVLPFNGIFRSTAESRGIDFDKMCRERPYAIWAMGEVLRQIKEQQAGTPGFTIWDDVAGFYFGGPNWNNPDWGDEIGNTVESYKYHPEGGVIVRMNKLDALQR